MENFIFYIVNGISEKSFSFNFNVKINNASLKLPMKVSTQKAKFNFYKNEIDIANTTNLKPVLWFCFKIKFHHNCFCSYT